MKKLMVVAAIVCAAAVGQAAQVDWKVSGTSVTQGTKIYLLTSIASTYESIAAFEGTAIDTGTIGVSGKGYGTGVVYSDNVGITKTGNYYLAAFTDAKTIKYLDVSDIWQEKVYDTSLKETSKGTASSSLANILASTATATIGGGGDVPEPTSAMLMLLGVAGLALRRKQK